MNDPEAYRLTSASFATADEAKSAVEEFLADVAEARARHRISDVVVLAEVSAVTASGERQFASSACYGYQRNKIHMLADAFSKALAALIVRAP